jgi:hypothetical protein
MSSYGSPSRFFVGYEMCSWQQIMLNPKTPRLCIATLSFLNHLRRHLIFSQPYKFGMPQMIRPRPFQKLDPRDHLRPHPNTFLHLLRSESLAPPAGDRLRQINEGAVRDFQMLQPLEDRTPGRRNQAGPHPSCIDKVLAAVESHHNRINAQTVSFVNSAS